MTKRLYQMSYPVYLNWLKQDAAFWTGSSLAMWHYLPMMYFAVNARGN